MNDHLGFVVKLVVASTAIAYGIKVVGPLLPIPPTNAVALGIVILPTVIVGGILGWNAWFQS
ncbi:MAG: hypothetical protein IGR76_14645 [Synechococcales cyanobacterium T60_A2020_003]|nr:hypothetical protein [Synechococcales cyanobacterium T60_A2020_003]